MWPAFSLTALLMREASQVACNQSSSLSLTQVTKQREPSLEKLLAIGQFFYRNQKKTKTIIKKEFSRTFHKIKNCSVFASFHVFVFFHCPGLEVPRGGITSRVAALIFFAIFGSVRQTTDPNQGEKPQKTQEINPSFSLFALREKPPKKKRLCFSNPIFLSQQPRINFWSDFVLTKTKYFSFLRNVVCIGRVLTPNMFVGIYMLFIFVLRLLLSLLLLAFWQDYWSAGWLENKLCEYDMSILLV